MPNRFPNVPDVDFAVKDASLITSNVITVAQAAVGRTLAPADPLTLLLNALCTIIVQQRALIDAAGKNNFIGYASGAFLDNIAATTAGSLGPRLQASEAITTLQFTLTSALGYNVTVPEGTQVSAPNLAVFATDSDLTITAGQTTGTVLASATVAGSASNGLVAGQINQLVNWTQSFVVSAVNTTTSSGGADYESDDAYANRIYVLPEAFSVAGPPGAYEALTLSQNASISDVEVWSPSAGNVSIAVLMDNGAMPTSSVTTEIQNYFMPTNSQTRPLTDNVTVVAPTQVSFTVNVQYWISPDNSSASVQSSIQSAVTAAVNAWITYVQSKIGRNIDPSKLTQLVIDAGASRVNVVSPSLDVLTVPQIGLLSGTPTIAFQGLDNSD